MSAGLSNVENLEGVTIARNTYVHAWNVRQNIMWKLECETDGDQKLTRKKVSDNIDDVEKASKAEQNVMINSIIHTLLAAILLSGMIIYLKCKQRPIDAEKCAVSKKGVNVFFNFLFFIFFGIAITILTNNAHALKFIKDTSCSDKFANDMMNDLGEQLLKAKDLNVFALCMTCISMIMDSFLFIRGVKKWRNGTIGLPEEKV
jgi:hypothetical protein